MKTSMRFTLSIILLSTTLLSCQKGESEESATDTYVGLSTQTLQANMNNGGYAAGDEEAIYFYNFVSNEKIQLSRKDRQTGEITVLDEIEKEASVDGDILYSNLCLAGDYLYYVPYDCDNQEISNQLWRIKTDGTDKSVVIDKNVYQYQIYYGNLYYSSFSYPSGLYAVSLSGTSSLQLLDDVPDNFFITEDGIYYTGYTHDGGFHAQLMKLTIDMSGSSSSEVIYDSQRMLYALYSEDQKLYCLDFDASSAATLMQIDPTSKASSVEIVNLPYCRLSVASSILYLMIPEGDGSWQAGLYSYKPGTNSPTLIHAINSERFCLVGDNEVVYANHSDTEESGRFHQLYQCNLSGVLYGKVAQ